MVPGSVFIGGKTLAGAAGIEPANYGIKTCCLTTWLRPNQRGENISDHMPSGATRQTSENESVPQFSLRLDQLTEQPELVKSSPGPGATFKTPAIAARFFALLAGGRLLRVDVIDGRAVPSDGRRRLDWALAP